VTKTDTLAGENQNMQKTIVSISQDAQCFFRLALEAETLKDPERVLECFDRAIALEPTYVGAWNEKANFLDQIGRFNEALVCYDTAIKIDAGAAEAWFNKGLTLKRLGRETEGIACINRGIGLAAGQSD
jgi:tetratricopeptide (TPR) repeat protein